jgi:hypothetical protein
MAGSVGFSQLNRARTPEPFGLLVERSRGPSEAGANGSTISVVGVWHLRDGVTCRQREAGEEASESPRFVVSMKR